MVNAKCRRQPSASVPQHTSLHAASSVKQVPSCSSVSETWHVVTLLMQVSEYISTFVSTAEGAVRDIPAEQVSVPAVTELSREAFVAGVSSTTAVRDHIKVCLCPEALQQSAQWVPPALQVIRVLDF